MQIPDYISNIKGMGGWPGVPEPAQVQAAAGLLARLGAWDNGSLTALAASLDDRERAGASLLKDAHCLQQRMRNENRRGTLVLGTCREMTPAAIFRKALEKLDEDDEHGFKPREEPAIVTITPRDGDYSVEITTVPEHKRWMGFDPAYRSLQGNTALVMLRIRSAKRAQGIVLLNGSRGDGRRRPGGNDSAAALCHGAATHLAPQEGAE